MKIDIAAKVESNLLRTRFVVILAFATNAVMNVLLIGFLARVGGLDFVGTWAFISAVLMNALILDLGMTNALTYKIGKAGVASGLPFLRLLGRWSNLLLLVVMGLVGAALVLRQPLAAALSLTIAAAILQLRSNWYCAVRMGQHEQYWFNVQTILRVIVQSLASVLLILGFPNHPELAFATAMLIGNMAALGLSWQLARKDLRQDSPTAFWMDLGHLVSDFGLENAAQRAFQPMSQLAVAHFLGSASLGIFTIALRIPVVMNQSISEALRVLLPGIAWTLRNGDERRVVEMLRGALVTQLVLVIPVMAFVTIHAKTILIVWLGSDTDEIVSALRMLCGSMSWVAIAVPFYWSMQATGQARLIALSVTARLLAVLAFGSLTMAMGGGILLFTAIFALGQVGDALFTIAASERKYGYLRKCLSQIRLLRLGAFLIASLSLNLWLSLSRVQEMQPHLGLTVVMTANLALIGFPGFFLLRKRWL
ncbi:MAG: oligosaccharide flippase family protein [Pseudomonadota bacterium]